MIKYLGLERGTFRATSREFHDIDYADQLNCHEKEWLAQFLDEWYSGKFRKDVPALHRTQDERRAIWREDKRRQNDVYGVQAANNALLWIDSVV